MPKFQASVRRRTSPTSSSPASSTRTTSSARSPTRSAAGTAVIDVSEIERINSCGVRDWVNWLGKVEKGGAKIVLVECSPAIVAQINLVNNFTGSGVVKSFYAPYFCPNCDLEKVLLVETRDMARPRSRSRRRPAAATSATAPMDFDDMEDSYFAFLVEREEDRPTPSSRTYLDGDVNSCISSPSPKACSPAQSIVSSIARAGLSRPASAR